MPVQRGHLQLVPLKAGRKAIAVKFHAQMLKFTR
eukprot:COSAG02_NODE_63039_length_264_cov_0.630303_1_plen_33_part_10